MVNFPTTLDDDDSLFVAVNNLRTQLTADIDISTLTIPVTSTAGFPDTGFISILTGTNITDTEAIRYTSTAPTQFNASERGAGGTTAFEHRTGNNVDLTIVSDHHNELKNAIIILENFVGVSGAENFLPLSDEGNVIVPGTLLVSGTSEFCDDSRFKGSIKVQEADVTGSLVSTFQDTLQQTSSSSYVDSNCETSALSKDVPYLVLYCGAGGGSTVTNQVELRLQHGSTTIAETRARVVLSSATATNATNIAGFTMVSGTGSDTLKMQFREINGASTANTQYLGIVGVPLNSPLIEGKDYFLSTTNEDTNVITNAPTGFGAEANKASEVTFDIPASGGGNYLYLGSIEGGGIGATSDMQVRFSVDGTKFETAAGDYTYRLATQQTTHGFTTVKLLNLSEGEHTFLIEGASVTSAVADFRRPRQILIKQGSYDQLKHKSTTNTLTQPVANGYLPFSSSVLTQGYTANQDEELVVFTNVAHQLTNASEARSRIARTDTSEVFREDYNLVQRNLGTGTADDAMNLLMIHQVAVTGTESSTWRWEGRAGAGTFPEEALFGAQGSSQPLEASIVVWGITPSARVGIECTSIDQLEISTPHLIAEDVEALHSLTISGVPVATGIEATIPDPLTLDEINANNILTVSGIPVNIGTVVSSLNTLDEAVTVTGVGTVENFTEGSTIVISGTLTVRETDSNPLVNEVTEIVVTTGTLTDLGGGTVQINTGGGGGAGGPFVDSLNTITGDVTITGAGTVDVITIGSAITTSGTLIVRESDNSPIIADVREIVVTTGTLTDLGGGVAQIDTGGGGGGGSGDGAFDTLTVSGVPVATGTNTVDVWMVDAPPANPDSRNDEFNNPGDGSGPGGLDSKWSLWDPGSLGSVTTSFTTSQVYLNVSTGVNMVGLYQPVDTDGPWSLYAKLGIVYRAGGGSDEAVWGVFFAEDIVGSPSTASFCGWAVHMQEPGAATNIPWRLTARQHTDSTTDWQSGTLRSEDVRALAGADEVHLHLANEIYFRVRNTGTGNNIVVDWSTTGLGWSEMGNIPKNAGGGIDPEYAGIFVRKVGGSTTQLRCDWFRFIDGNSERTQDIPGRLVRVGTAI